MKFEIFTENKNLPQTIALTIRRFPNSTFVQSMGVYKGVPEEGLIITILAPENDRSTIQSLARDIKEMNKQESVLVVETPVTYNLV